MKNNNYNECAELFKAIAHPVRLKILKELKNGKKCVSDINELIDISQPNLSQHLKILFKDKLIDYTEEGKHRCYFIYRKKVAAIITILEACDSIIKID